MYIQNKSTGFYYAGMLRGQPRWVLLIADALDVNNTQVDGLIANLRKKGIECGYSNLVKPVGYNDHPAPYVVYGTGVVPIDQSAIQQLVEVLRILPARRGAQMPDAQKGYTISIGGVVALSNAVMPMGVGVDIGCRMMLSILGMSVAEFYAKREAIWETLKSKSGLGLASHADDEVHSIMTYQAWKDIPILNRSYANAQSQLGTLGRGNHFAVIGIMEMNGKNQVILLTHGGSRNTGKVVAEFYARLAEEDTHAQYSKVPRGLGWLDLATQHGQEYWTAMNLLAEYAEANHALTHDRIIKALGISRIGERYTNAHNIAVQENGLVVMRKGATKLVDGKYALIPGSSGTKSYLVRGKGDPNNPGDNLNSGPHGAGRVQSTSNSKKEFEEVHAASYDEDMRARDIWTHGVDAGETWHAYKDVDSVIQVMADAGALDVEGVITPKLVVMGGADRADDAN